ncbi:hypothetical protein ACWEOE_14535 [Amycolatopsis sp. NPDC004368]
MQTWPELAKAANAIWSAATSRSVSERTRVACHLKRDGDGHAWLPTDLELDLPAR